MIAWATFNSFNARLYKNFSVALLNGMFILNNFNYKNSSNWQSEVC